MLLQTNSYVVPKDRRSEHARLLRRFRQTLARLGCDHFEAYEQVGQNWNTGESSGRFVQIMRFRDRRHQLAVQAAERNDPLAQQLIAEFCELINFPYQQQHGLFAVGFYTSALPVAPARPGAAAPAAEEPDLDAEIAAQAAAAATVASEVPPPDQQTYVAQAPAPADFSGEPVTPQDAEPTESAEVEPEVSIPEAAEVAPDDQAPTEEIGSVPEPAEFRQEMEALGAEIEQESPAPAAETSEATLEDQPIDVSLPKDIEARAEAEEEHAAGGNGSPVDRAASEESTRFGNGEALAHDDGPEMGSHGAFDALLDDHFDSEPSGSQAAPEHEPVSSGSGIGQVLDAGLSDEDDLDIELPADLIEDELEPHAPEANRPEGRDPRRA